MLALFVMMCYNVENMKKRSKEHMKKFSEEQENEMIEEYIKGVRKLAKDYFNNLNGAIEEKNFNINTIEAMWEHFRNMEQIEDQKLTQRMVDALDESEEIEKKAEKFEKRS